MGPAYIYFYRRFICTFGMFNFWRKKMRANISKITKKISFYIELDFIQVLQYSIMVGKLTN